MSREPTPADIEIGDAIRQARRVRGLSQEALAERISVTKQALQLYETGENRIPAVRLREICDVLEFTPNALLRRAATENEQRIDTSEAAALLNAFMALSKRHQTVIRTLVRDLQKR